MTSLTTSLLLLLAFASHVCAGDAVARFRFSGVVSSVSDSIGYLGDSFRIGDPAAGTVAYAWNVADIDAQEKYGVYNQDGPPASISFSISGHRFRSAGSDARFHLTVKNGLAGTESDNFIMLSNDVALPSRFDLGGNAAIDFQLTDGSGLALASDALPRTVDLASWPDSPLVEVIHSDLRDPEGHYRIIVSIDSLTPVPEPRAMLLRAIGASAMFLAGQRFRRTN
jgi:hypothetical protein